MTAKTEPISYGIQEAAKVVGYSVPTLRRAIKSHGGEGEWPPLKAKSDHNGRYLIKRADLEAWIDSFPDA